MTKMRAWKWISAAAVGAVLVAAQMVAAADSTKTVAAVSDPVEVIRTKDSELQRLLRDKEKKTDRIKTLINGIFDFEELGRRALGPAQWGKMSAAQQAHFVKAFREMVENSSVKKLEAYVSDSTRYDKPEGGEGKTNVTAHVFSKGAESIVTYKLLLKQGIWKAWDLVIDDLSTAGNYGDQFRKILEKNTVDDLIAKLEKKGNSGPAPKTADNVKSKSEKTSKASAAKKSASPGS